MVGVMISLAKTEVIGVMNRCLVGNNVRNNVRNNKVYRWGIIAAVVFITAVIKLVFSYGADYRFKHELDTIDMLNNSITYTYKDNANDKNSNRTYTIQNDWLPQMKVRRYNSSFSEGADTDITMYGPYVWLPAGKYRVKINFTKDGGSAFEQYDVCTNFGKNGSKTKPYNYSGRLEIGNGAYISNQKYVNSNPNDKYLEYIIETNGDASDYEFRLFFNAGGLGESIDSTANNDIGVLHRFVRSISITAEYNNTITLDANGGSLKTATDTTTWGQSREKLSESQIPEKVGYKFAGYYGYTKASNETNLRSGLKFDTTSDKVKLWNKDGTAVTGAEVSYYDYTVYAEWTPDEGTKYKVEHYKMKVDGTYSDIPDEVENMTGTTDSKVTPATKTYTGFTSPAASKVTIAADGSTVVQYRYSRNQYEVIIKISHQNTLGAWEDDQDWIKTTKYYGESYHYDGYGNDTDGSDNAEYYNICASGTVTEKIETTVKAYRRKYLLNFSWDDGVSIVTGTDNSGNGIVYQNGQGFSYYYGRIQGVKAYLKYGYYVDYVEETTPGHTGQYTDIFNNTGEAAGWKYAYENLDIKGYDRSFKIHTIYKHADTLIESHSRIIKAASTMYNATLVRRTESDEQWYNSVGSKDISRLKEYTNDQCIQTWRIESDGSIVRR